MNEYELEVKVKNHLLLEKMRSNGYNTNAELSRASGISSCLIGDAVNLKTPAFNKNGEMTKIYEYLTSFFKCEIMCICPFDNLNDPILNNRFTIEINAEEAKIIANNSNFITGIAPSPVEVIEREQSENIFNIDSMISELTKREKLVLKLRYEESISYNQIGEIVGVCSNRVRGIEAKALHKLRNPKRVERLEMLISGEYDENHGDE